MGAGKCREGHERERAAYQGCSSIADFDDRHVSIRTFSGISKRAGSHSRTTNVEGIVGGIDGLKVDW